MYLLEGILYSPSSVNEKIKEYCDDVEQQRNQLVQYWRRLSPYASWSSLAGQLQRFKEQSALAAAVQYVQRAPGVAVACIYIYIGMYTCMYIAVR